MSAYLCNPEHIGQLAIAMARKEVPIAGRRFDKFRDAAKIAAILAKANWDSVNYRYQDADIGLEQYVAECMKAARHQDILLKAVDLIKMAKCFEYQACEDPAYGEASYEKGFGAWNINYLISQLLYDIPGYDEAIRDYEGSDQSIVRIA